MTSPPVILTGGNSVSRFVSDGWRCREPATIVLMERKPIFPAFPQTRALPWVLGAGALVSLIYGIVEGITGYEVLGGAGLAGLVVAYPLARLVLGPAPCSDDDDPR